MAKSKSTKKLEQLVHKEVTSMFESVLDYAQVAVSDPQTFKVLRSKILRVGNNCIRSINSKLDDYDIKYVGEVGEDIIEFCDKK